MAPQAAPQISEEDQLLRSDVDGIARLTLNRPKASNSLSLGLMAALQNELTNIRADSNVRVVVIAARDRKSVV